MPRPIHVIAQEIKANWPNVYFGATPYLSAMRSLNLITDSYYEDSAASIVRYFLGNATTWKGEVARNIKKELKAML